MKNNSKYYYISNENMSEYLSPHSASKNPSKSTLKTSKRTRTRKAGTSSPSPKTSRSLAPTNSPVRASISTISRKRISSHSPSSLHPHHPSGRPSIRYSLRSPTTRLEIGLLKTNPLIWVSRSGKPFKYACLHSGKIFLNQ